MLGGVFGGGTGLDGSTQPIGEGVDGEDCGLPRLHPGRDGGLRRVGREVVRIADGRQRVGVRRTNHLGHAAERIVDGSRRLAVLIGGAGDLAGAGIIGQAAGVAEDVGDLGQIRAGGVVGVGGRPTESVGDRLDVAVGVVGERGGQPLFRGEVAPLLFFGEVAGRIVGEAALRHDRPADIEDVGERRPAEDPVGRVVEEGGRGRALVPGDGHVTVVVAAREIAVAVVGEAAAGLLDGGVAIVRIRIRLIELGEVDPRIRLSAGPGLLGLGPEGVVLIAELASDGPAFLVGILVEGGDGLVAVHIEDGGLLEAPELLRRGVVQPAVESVGRGVGVPQPIGLRRLLDDGQHEGQLRGGVTPAQGGGLVGQGRGAAQAIGDRPQDIGGRPVGAIRVRQIREC